MGLTLVPYGWSFTVLYQAPPCFCTCTMVFMLDFWKYNSYSYKVQMTYSNISQCESSWHFSTQTHHISRLQEVQPTEDKVSGITQETNSPSSWVCLYAWLHFLEETAIFKPTFQSITFAQRTKIIANVPFNNFDKSIHSWKHHPMMKIQNMFFSPEVSTCYFSDSPSCNHEPKFNC